MFKIVIKTAFLSLLRRKMRTMMVIIMIAVSLWGLLFMQGLYEGMYEQMINNAIKSDCGQISLYKQGFKQDKMISLQIENFKEVDNYLQHNKAVKNYTNRILTDGLIATASYAKATQIYGIKLQTEKQNSALDKYIIDGKFSFTNGTRQKDNGVIVGFKLAKKLKLQIGKKVIVSAQDINNEVNSISLRVTGIIKTNNMQLDENGIFVDIHKMQKFLNIKAINQIFVIYKDGINLENEQKKLQKQFNTLEVFRWDEQYPALFQAQVMMKQFDLISYLIVFITATIGIFGVILVSVLERTREFGILKAIGTKFSIIALIVFCESLFMGIIGFIIGILLGGTTLYYFSIYGLDLRNFADALDQFGMDSIIFATVKLDYFIMAFISVFIATILSVLIPLRILKKSKPTTMIQG